MYVPRVRFVCENCVLCVYKNFLCVLYYVFVDGDNLLEHVCECLVKTLCCMFVLSVVYYMSVLAGRRVQRLRGVALGWLACSGVDSKPLATCHDGSTFRFYMDSLYLNTDSVDCWNDLTRLSFELPRLGSINLNGTFWDNCQDHLVYDVEQPIYWEADYTMVLEWCNTEGYYSNAFICLSALNGANGETTGKDDTSKPKVGQAQDALAKMAELSSSLNLDSWDKRSGAADKFGRAAKAHVKFHKVVDVKEKERPGAPGWAKEADGREVKLCFDFGTPGGCKRKNCKFQHVPKEEKVVPPKKEVDDEVAHRLVKVRNHPRNLVAWTWSMLKWTVPLSLGWFVFLFLWTGVNPSPDMQVLVVLLSMVVGALFLRVEDLTLTIQGIQFDKILWPSSSDRVLKYTHQGTVMVSMRMFRKLEEQFAGSSDSNHVTPTFNHFLRQERNQRLAWQTCLYFKNHVEQRTCVHSMFDGNSKIPTT